MMEISESKTLKLYRELRGSKEFENIREAYFYACPRRYNAKENTIDKLTDSTAIKALNARTNDMHGKIYPPFRRWINLVPAIPIPESIEPKWKKHKAEAEEKMSMAVELSNFHLEIDDVLDDAAICEGALLLHQGTPEEPFIFEAVPWDAFVTKLSYNKRPETNFLWRDNISLKEIKYRWPEANVKDLEEDKKYTIIDCFLYDDEKDNYVYEVWTDNPEKMLLQKKDVKSSPWNVYRFNRKMYGNTGYGPVNDSLPDIKTINKTRELILKNAAMAISGMWQCDDDGVINPDTIKLVPGSIIPKAAGSKGITPLDTNRNFDVSQIIVSDLQQVIKENIMGNSLPDPNTGIRTAYELASRKEEAANTEIPLMLRISLPNSKLGARMYDILTSDGMKSSPFYIRPFQFTAEGENMPTTVKVRMANPLIDLQKEVDSQKELQALGNAAAMFGDLPMKLIDRVGYTYQYLIDNGFDPAKMPDIEISRKKIEEEEKLLLQAKAAYMAQQETKVGQQ